MPIDYSKWDKLELSDDSDIEVHPNVDKQSFIRWKQQDIHQKRDQRNHDISTLEIQVPMYVELNRRVDKLLGDCDDDTLADYQKVCEYLKKTFDASSKPEGVEEDAPTYNEMIEDLFTDLKKQLEKASQDPNDGKLLRQEVLAHRTKIDNVLLTQRDKLKTLYKERELHISSDDIKTGWDRSFLNKDGSKPAELTPANTVEAKPTTASPSTPARAQLEPHTAVATTQQQQHQTLQAVEDKETVAGLDFETIALSKIPLNDFDKIKQYLKAHTYLIKQEQKDSLLMSAFDAQFAHDDSLTQQIIGHSILLQYVMDIMSFKKVSHPLEIQQIIETLFGKMFSSASNPALEAFHNELRSTFEHIKTRCQVLASEQHEQDEGDVEEIQLKSLDDDKALVVNLPDESSTEPDEISRCKLFAQLPGKMQTALRSESLDEVNEVFHGMPIAEAEEILEIFEQADIIGVRAVLENENDWELLKDEYAKTNKGEEDAQPTVTQIQELDIEEPARRINTADIVD